MHIQQEAVTVHNPQETTAAYWEYQSYRARLSTVAKLTVVVKRAFILTKKKIGRNKE